MPDSLIADLEKRLEDERAENRQVRAELRKLRTRCEFLEKALHIAKLKLELSRIQTNERDDQNRR